MLDRPRNFLTQKGQFMNKATRMVTMTGMALIAGVTMGAGPASAATPGAASSSSARAAEHRVPGHDHDRVVGYYRSSGDCYQAGHFGQRQNQWDDYRCVQIRGDFRRGRWALVVTDNDHGQRGHGHDGHDSHDGNGGNGGHGR
jgi:hypothetical protein